MNSPMTPADQTARGRMSRRLMLWAIALLVLLGTALMIAVALQSPGPQQGEQARKDAELKRLASQAAGSPAEVDRLADAQEQRVKAEKERDEAKKRLQSLLDSMQHPASATSAATAASMPNAVTVMTGTELARYEHERNQAQVDAIESDRPDLVGWVANDTTQSAGASPAQTGAANLPAPAQLAAAGTGASQSARDQSLALLASLRGAGTAGGSPGGANQQWADGFAGARSPSPAVPVLAISPHTVHQGTAIELATTRAINSDIPGSLEARVVRDVYDTIDSSHVVVPMGTRLTGPYNSDVLPGQSRLQGGFTRMIFPNGSSVDIGGSQLSDRLGEGGLDGHVNYHLFRSLALQFAVAGIAKLTKVDNGGGGSGGALYGGSSSSSAGQILVNTMQNFSQQFMNMKATITVPPGTPFTVTLSRDLILPPDVTVSPASFNSEDSR